MSLVFVLIDVPRVSSGFGIGTHPNLAGRGGQSLNSKDGYIVLFVWVVLENVCLVFFS